MGAAKWILQDLSYMHVGLNVSFGSAACAFATAAAHSLRPSSLYQKKKKIDTGTK